MLNLRLGSARWEIRNPAGATTSCQTGRPLSSPHQMKGQVDSTMTDKAGNAGKAVVYARYSSERQRAESIEDQVRVCREFAEGRGLEIVEVYSDEAISGRTDMRPAIQKMSAESSRGCFSTVVVYKLDRFARDRYDMAVNRKLLRDNGVEVVSATENIPDSPEGIILDGMISAMAEWYSANLSQNVLRGMTGNALKCKWNGVRVYGYDVDGDGNYVINPDEAENVRWVFENAGTSLRELADELVRRGAKTPLGKKPDTQFVRGMLGREKYTGVYIWGDVRIEGGMPQIVSRELFDSAQKRVRPRRYKAGKACYPLVGKAGCSCGGSLHGEVAKNHAGKPYHYYVCGKCGKRVRQRRLEDAIAGAVRRVLDADHRAALVDRLVAYGEGGGVEERKKAIRSRMADARRRRERIVKAIESGMPAEGMVEAMREAIDDEKAAKDKLEGMNGTLTREEISVLLDVMLERGAVEGFVQNVIWSDSQVAVTLNMRQENAPDLEEVRGAIAELDSSANCDLAPPAGFEPAIFGLKGRRPNR